MIRRICKNCRYYDESKHHIYTENWKWCRRLLRYSSWHNYSCGFWKFKGGRRGKDIFLDY